MAGEKKTLKVTAAGTLGRDKDIRVRYVKPETFRQLAAVMKSMNEKYIPDTITRLIAGYIPDQDLISMLQKRNTQLHAIIAQLNKEREEAKKLLADFIAYTDKFNRMTITKAKATHKKLCGAKKRRQTR